MAGFLAQMPKLAYAERMPVKFSMLCGDRNVLGSHFVNKKVKP